MNPDVPFDPTRTQILRRRATNPAPASPCPHCSVILNFHVTPDGKDSNPAPGNVTVCGCCNSFLVFESDLSLRLPTKAEKAVMFRSLDEQMKGYFPGSH